MPRRPLRSSLSSFLVVLAAVAAWAAGCAPTCGATCRKLLFDCDLDTQRVALEECEQSCALQDALYQDWENDELRERLRDHRRCIGRATCEEIADGECYDERLFVIDPEL